MYPQKMRIHQSFLYIVNMFLHLKVLKFLLVYGGFLTIEIKEGIYFDISIFISYIYRFFRLVTNSEEERYRISNRRSQRVLENMKIPAGRKPAGKQGPIDQ